MAELKDKLIREIKVLPRRRFVKDVTILQLGKFFSIGISVLASIIFARILHAERYGIYSIIFALVATIEIFMNWGVGPTVVTLLAEAYAKKDRLAVKDLLCYLFKTHIIAWVIIGGCGIIVAPILAYKFYGDYQIGYWARVILVADSLVIFSDLAAMVLQVLRQMKTLAVLQNLQKFIQNLITICLVLIGFGLAGIIWGYFFSGLIILFVAVILYSALARREDMLPSWWEIISTFWQIQLKKYFKFNFLVAIDKNFSALYSLLPILMTGFILSASDVSYYKIAYAYIMIPSQFLAPISLLLGVQLPQSKVVSLKKLKGDFLRVSFTSCLLSLGLVLPLIALVKPLVVFFYGVEYLAAIPLVFILAISAVLNGLEVGIGPIFRTLNRIDLTIKTNAVLIILEVILIFILAELFGLLGLALAVTIIFVLVPLINFLLAWTLLNKQVRNEI